MKRKSDDEFVRERAEQAGLTLSDRQVVIIREKWHSSPTLSLDGLLSGLRRLAEANRNEVPATTNEMLKNSHQTTQGVSGGEWEMYECDRITCGNYVSHPGQLCLGCQQAEDADVDDDEDYDDVVGHDTQYQNAEWLCIKCGTREAIVNRVCGMCSELYPAYV